MGTITPYEYYMEAFENYKKNKKFMWNGVYEKAEDSPFICPRVYCNDGFSFSMQASKFHYSIPAVAGYSYYSAMEIGYPSDPEPLLEPYVDRFHYSDYYHPNVYPFVGYKTIEQIVEKHGGIRIKEK